MERKKGSVPKPVEVDEEVQEVEEVEETVVRRVPKEAVMTRLPAKEVDEVTIRAKLRYRKLGGGSLTMFGRTYKYNDIVECYPEQIPEVFKDVLQCLSSPEDVKRSIAEGKGLFNKETLYAVVPSILAGSFNVVNTETKKQINERQLSKADAEKLCSSLNL